jgi:acid phosphatase
VVVVEENHSRADVIGSRQAPYLNALARDGASFIHSTAITHPSQPNYLALFSGSTHGVTSDSCPHRFGSNNLGNELRRAGLSFTGYSESLPQAGFLGCTDGAYARKHVPWTDFTDLPASVNRPFSAFPTDFTKLPTLSFVIPNLNHDMHDGTVAQGDTWLRTHLSSYVRWMRTHQSLLVVTWDENDGSAGNQIPTIFAGYGVVNGSYGQRINHYRVLRTLEASYGLPALGAAAQTTPIRAIFPT